MSSITVLPSHSYGGTLQNLDITLLHSSMQMSADHRSRQHNVIRMTDDKGETWSPSGMSKLRSRPESLVTMLQFKFSSTFPAIFIIKQYTDTKHTGNYYKLHRTQVFWLQNLQKQVAFHKYRATGWRAKPIPVLLPVFVQSSLGSQDEQKKVHQNPSTTVTTFCFRYTLQQLCLSITFLSKQLKIPWDHHSLTHCRD